MKIIEAQRLYQAQQVSLREQKKKLLQQKEALQKKMSATNNGKEIYANEAAALELSIGAITQKTEENNEVLNTLAEQYAAVWNTEAAKQQGEAMKEYGEDMAKILEVARRIAKGAKVPATDEKKLMKYSMEMYMSAKNLAMMNRQRKKEEYDSLWDDEEEQTEYDSQGKADHAETDISAPEALDVGAEAGDGAMI